MPTYRYILHAQFPNARFVHVVRSTGGITVTARKLWGTWNAGTIPVKWRPAGTKATFAFDPVAKTLSDGSGAGVRISSAELEGVGRGGEIVGEISAATNNDCGIEVVVHEQEE
jgi:hypothetical protein